jgi:hypothetical protein
MGETITRAGDGMVGPPVLPGTLLRIFNTELTEDTEKRREEKRKIIALRAVRLAAFWTRIPRPLPPSEGQVGMGEAQIYAPC